MDVLEYMGVAYAVLLALRGVLVAVRAVDMADGKADWAVINLLVSVVDSLADVLSARTPGKK